MTSNGADRSIRRSKRALCAFRFALLAFLASTARTADGSEDAVVGTEDPIGSSGVAVEVVGTDRLAGLSVAVARDERQSLFFDDFLNDHNVASDSVASNGTCASILDCKSCSDTYTCHWCDADEACHAKGSVHGCAWGSTCKNNPAPAPSPAPKDNTTCAAQATCTDCALLSSLCHWCAHDNACHAIGSPYGCTTGVDCYSNDRCRRETPEKLQRVIVTKMPYWAMGAVVGVAAAIIGFMSCCYCFAGGVKGAYDDLATITMAASVAPLSVIGGPTFRASEFQTNLETHREDDEDEAASDAPAATSGDIEQPSDTVVETANDTSTYQTAAPDDNDRTETSAQVESTSAIAADPPAVTTNEQQSAPTNNEDTMQHDTFPNDMSTPLLQADGQHRAEPYMSPADLYAMNDMEPPSHMNRLYKFCGCFYYLAVLLIVALTVTVIYLYPIVPIYNVCNDAVAWSKIITQITSAHLGATFEILISVENLNHVNVALDRGTGVFRYDDQQVGTFVIPPVLVGAMSITDMMIIAKLEPDKIQAIQIASDYYKGNLVLDADFKADLRTPGLFNLGLAYTKKDFVVNVNQLSDRSLCHCPTWDDHKTKAPVLIEWN